MIIQLCCDRSLACSTTLPHESFHVFGLFHVARFFLLIYQLLFLWINYKLLYAHFNKLLHNVHLLDNTTLQKGLKDEARSIRIVQELDHL